MARGGVQGDASVQTLQQYTNASSFAAAMQIGRFEAQAAINLLRNVSQPTREKLTELVREHSMQKFITHEAIAHGVFNEVYTSASGPLAPWERHLSNTPELLRLLTARMGQDFLSLNPKMRKAWNQKELDLCLPIVFVAGWVKGGPLATESRFVFSIVIHPAKQVASVGDEGIKAAQSSALVLTGCLV